MGKKLPERETDHSSSCNAKVKNARSFHATVFVVLQLSTETTYLPLTISYDYFKTFPENLLARKKTALSNIFIHSFIHQCLYSPLLGPGFFFSSVNFFSKTVGLLGRGISPSQGPYLHIEQQKHRINTQTSMP
jgi:hypothetical protein